MLIDGKAIATEIHEEVKAQIAALGGRPPCLAVILVGDDPASEIYVRRKTEACESVGIHSLKRLFPSTITQAELLEEIEALNSNPTVDGILVQLPLPKHIDAIKITEALDPEKDIDGFHPFNAGKLLIGLPDGYCPCTPLGVIRLFEKTKISLEGKNVVIIGRSNIVGKPMAALLMKNGSQSASSVTVLHRYSTDLKTYCQLADVIIVAVGIPRMITKDMVKPGAIVIDIGINRILDSNKKSGFRIVGDVDFDEVKEVASMITPVPGGVGPVTIAVLLENTLKSYLKRRSAESCQKNLF